MKRYIPSDLKRLIPDIDRVIPGPRCAWNGARAPAVPFGLAEFEDGDCMTVAVEYNSRHCESEGRRLEAI